MKAGDYLGVIKDVFFRQLPHVTLMFSDWWYEGGWLSGWYRGCRCQVVQPCRGNDETRTYRLQAIHRAVVAPLQCTYTIQYLESVGMRLYLFASASLRFFQEIFASHVFASFFLPTCSHILTVVVTSAKFSVWSKNASAIYVHVVVASAGLLRRAVFASFLELSRMASKKCTPRFRWREDTK